MNNICFLILNAFIIILFSVFHDQVVSALAGNIELLAIVLVLSSLYFVNIIAPSKKNFLGLFRNPTLIVLFLYLVFYKN